MIVTLTPGSDPEAVQRALAGLGLWVVRHDGAHGNVRFHIRAHSADVSAERVAAVEGVADVARPPSPHPLIDARVAPVAIGSLEIGPGCPPVLMAGPCSVESETQIERLAERLAASGVRVLRGGGFKPRSSPYAFRGHGAEALAWMRGAADRHGLLVVSEALSEASVTAASEHADIVQIGSRNMHNYALLERVASCGRPILLKRGMSATLAEWLLAGEYCLLHGAASVIFCERGVRGFDDTTRNLLDLASVALLSRVHGQAVIVDPSHALGRRDLVLPLSAAALAAGAHGLLVEVHERPEDAMSDGPQALPLDAVPALARLVAASDQAQADGPRRRPVRPSAP